MIRMAEVSSVGLGALSGKTTPPVPEEQRPLRTRPMKPDNLFSSFPPGASGEVFETLVRSGSVEIERIVSHGESSPPGFWYDQDRSEWVVLLDGAAALRFEGEDQPVVLGPGDYLHIPAHARHRVEWTRQDGPTLWLAVFFPPDGDAGGLLPLPR